MLTAHNLGGNAGIKDAAESSADFGPIQVVVIVFGRIRIVLTFIDRDCCDLSIGHFDGYENLIIEFLSVVTPAGTCVGAVLIDHLRVGFSTGTGIRVYARVGIRISSGIGFCALLFRFVISVHDRLQQTVGTQCRTGDCVDFRILPGNDLLQERFCLIEVFGRLILGAYDRKFRDLAALDCHLDDHFASEAPSGSLIDAVNKLVRREKIRRDLRLCWF